MRQVLLRIRLDELFSFEPIENVTAVGIGYLLLLVWIVLGLKVTLQYFLRNSSRAEDSVSTGWTLWFGVMVTAAILVIRYVLGRMVDVTSIPVFGYGFMLFIAFVLAVQTACWRLRSEGLASDFVWDFAMWLFFSGIVGARLFYVIEYRDNIFAGKQGFGEHFWAAVNLPDGGLVLYGGLIMSVVPVTAFLIHYCRRHKLNPLYLADVIVPSLFVGIACGRLGCFLNGCCYGERSDSIWAVTFPVHSVPYQALQLRGLLPPDALACPPLHPTQLYSLLNAIVLAVLTTVYFKYRTRNGAVVALAMIVYPVSRFVIEILRWDEPALWGTGMTVSQLVSLVVFAIGLGMAAWCFSSRRPAVANTDRSSSADAPAAA